MGPGAVRGKVGSAKNTGTVGTGPMPPPRVLLSNDGDHESNDRAAPQAVRLDLAKPGVVQEVQRDGDWAGARLCHHVITH